jgi:hypothetical protein
MREVRLELYRHFHSNQFYKSHASAKASCNKRFNILTFHTNQTNGLAADIRSQTDGRDLQKKAFLFTKQKVKSLV